MPRWTAESRLKQAEKIRNWSPWTLSTGPRTAIGRARSSRNAFKGGVHTEIATFAGVMREIETANREVISSFCRGAIFPRVRSRFNFRRDTALAGVGRCGINRELDAAPYQDLDRSNRHGPNKSGVALSLPTALRDASRQVKRFALNSTVKNHRHFKSHPIGQTGVALPLPTATHGRFATDEANTGWFPPFEGSSKVAFSCHPLEILKIYMYGLVNKAVEELVVSNFGADKWEAVKAKAGVDVDAFISTEGYPDEITYKLVGAAVEVLGMPAEQVLIAFGEHWVLKTAAENYGSMLKSGGKTLREFLVNLPNFHTRVAMIYPNLQPPRFVCSDVTDTSLKLHYHTHRPGLTLFVVGLVQGLGKLYETPVTCAIAERKEEGADHDVFDVTWTDAA